MAFTAGQAKCIGTLDRSLVVAAGAGSGKTFTLTKRIVHALESGAVEDIGRVCAITFTNKAAGELKARIKSELRACGLADQALAVDEAWVSTIHGMCARILRAHALELGLDPRFAMADAPLANMLLDRAVEETLARAQAAAAIPPDADSSAPAGASGLPATDGAVDRGLAGSLPDRGAIDALFAEYPARSYGPRSSSVESMLKALVAEAGSRPDGFASFTWDEARANPAAVVDSVLDAFESVAQAAATQKPNEAREAWAANAADAAARIRREMQEGHASDALWALSALDSLEWPKKVGTAEYKLRVAEAADAYRSGVMELRLAAAGAHMATLVALARVAHGLFADAKRREGVLDNDDLLVLAYGAVTGNASIAAEYSDKFQLVMVDEFQDTDQMQVDMVKALAGPGACRLCTVGDAQQSIYRFRGADVAVYNRHLGQVESVNAEDVIRLDANFRSHSDVLRFVDCVFGQPDVFGASFMSLSAGRDESRVKRPFAAGVPRIRVQLTSSESRGVSADQVRQVAAARIADAFAELKRAGHSAGDMAVLLGGMSHAGVYADALRARGLACVISGGSVFARTPEALLVRDLVRVIANPYQTKALHNVLTGPLFQLEAGDLLDLATVVGADGSPRRGNLTSGLLTCAFRLRKEQADPRWSPQLVLALRVMGEVIDASGRVPVAAIAMRALVESGLVSRLQAQGAEGLACAGNLYKAVRMVEAVEAASPVGPAGVDRMFQAVLAESKEAPGALSATGGDFVRIMTVHASKGLEFPIVAVGEFRDSAGSSDKLLVGEVAGKLHLSLDLQNTAASFTGKAACKDASALYASLMGDRAGEDELLQAAERAGSALERRAALYEYERAGDEEEAKRLLYVALTRAKEALVVSLRGKAAKDNPLATPKGCMGFVVSALAGEGAGLPIGVAELGYGGSAPAVAEHVRLLKSDDGSVGFEGPPHIADVVSGTLAGPSCAAAPMSPADEGAFDIPLPTPRPKADRIPDAPAHEGVFSYSSVSEASHEGDLLDRLAARCFSSADRSAEERVFDLFLQPAADAQVDAAFDAARGSAGLSPDAEDDGSWAYAPTVCADADKATDLGMAFHRLAQHAVEARRDPVALAKPDSGRIAASAAGGLGQAQRQRLDEALDRWFGSRVAAFMAGYADLRAETPFFLKLPSDLVAEGAYLEGEIDLIGIDDAGMRATVVDYKTGGRADETEDELARKHVLQASCYAYAVMSQGIREVDAVFVRVERRADLPDAGGAGAPPDSRADSVGSLGGGTGEAGLAADVGEPQCVRYRFTADDLPFLAQSIAEAYGLARQGRG